MIKIQRKHKNISYYINNNYNFLRDYNIICFQ